ncbi:putative TIM barrel metal-dependent hydrolase [Stachybotrys elegans]|uniref:TIM barrel metal-dependent hydrolase n=1 Tax=Stachybotrys elegans TaxID=80388 RepID=A0A8K0T1J9_9HYPO|nr:putative TIM barrel metal-dependent hydrolase [Stachybotrys elegans]
MARKARKDMRSRLIERLKVLLSYLQQLFSRPAASQNSPAHAPKASVLSTPSPFRNILPVGSWDSHMHIIDPVRFPLSADALYTPSPYTLSQCRLFESSVSLDNIVIVQPSIYGNDNSCLLEALRELGPNRARGVVSFEPRSVSLSTLEEWHALGVRGVRVNFSSVGKTLDAEELGDLLESYAVDVCQMEGWVLQVYMPMAMMTLLEQIVPRLKGVRVCVDHMGHPSLPIPGGSSNPYDIAGFQSLVNLLRSGNAFVKFSAPYRLTDDVSYLEPVGRELLRVAGNDKLVFATDWPHTRFEGLDIQPWMQTVIGWCEDEGVQVERLFKTNAEDLWSVE